MTTDERTTNHRRFTRRGKARKGIGWDRLLHLGTIGICLLTGLVLIPKSDASWSIPEPPMRERESKAHDFDFPSATDPDGCFQCLPNLSRRSRLLGARLERMSDSTNAHIAPRAVAAGLAWLASQQTPEGYWCAQTTLGDPDQQTAAPDVGITALALLAFIGESSTTRMGRYRSEVKKGVKWLISQQDPETRFIGPHKGPLAVRNHAMASLALTENYNDSRNPFQKNIAGRALWFLEDMLKDRNEDSAAPERFAKLNTVDLYWVMHALTAGEDVRLRSRTLGKEAALEWIDSFTNHGSGHVLFELGLSKDTTHPTTKKADATAVGLFTQILLGRKVKDLPWFPKQKEIISQSTPKRGSPFDNTDMQSWHFGTYASFQIDGEYWTHWRNALEEAIPPFQRLDKDFHGSWDPVGKEGRQASRVHSTAMMVLTLQVTYRYPRLLEATRQE